MNYSQIRAFHHVAINQGFSRAAEALSLTQPAVSEQVRKLESDHDILLFNRERKQITLTENAEKLLHITKQFFELEEKINDLLSESRASLRGHLRIMVDSAFHLSDRLARFCIKYPDVSVSVLTGNSQDVLNSLRDYDVEIGVVGSETPGTDMQVTTLGYSPIVAIAGTPLFQKMTGRMDLARLREYPLVLREKGSKTRFKLEEEAARQSITLTPTVIAEGREAMLEVVASGVGVGFVSEAEFGHDPRLHKIRLDCPRLSMSESLIHLKQRRDLRIIKAFLNC